MPSRACLSAGYMAENESKSQLSSRDREILRDVILGFIGTGEPVSSRALAKLRRHGVSAATIRNVMADLEEMGLLMQPHTSAGRVPTASGYHLFIETMMETRELGRNERRYIDEHLRAGDSGDGLVGAATHLLTEMSGQAAVALTPALGDTVLKAIDFVPLTETPRAVRRGLHQRLRRFEADRDRGAGAARGAGADRQLPDRELRRSRAARDPRPPVADDGRGASANGPPAVAGHRPRPQGPRRRGRPRRAGRRRVDPARQAGAGRTSTACAACSMLSRTRRAWCASSTAASTGAACGCSSARTPSSPSELDFSLVATSYGSRERPLGTLGIFGPSRMEYPRLIPLVHYLGERLGQALGGGEE